MNSIRFFIFLFAFSAFAYNQIYARHQEYSVEKIAPWWYRRGLYENRTFESKDCFRDVEDARANIRCLALFYVWRWDMKTQSCVLTDYGGCFPTMNNFESLEECNKIAKPVCQQLVEDLKDINILDILDFFIYKVQN
ncbi:unnamed protein product [Diabrotica balteata]|uniref:BPTI/Kunitz inhibitor domain-containing protein n=1 Tax=Diabrotica balteata TaxID=107213 RepID=A0A9N9XE59_DIABA|nr:unnamed protein product [Diabrotica balteata]